MRVVFVCSRDFQVKNCLSLIESFKCSGQKIEPIILSISRWTHGGASKLLAESGVSFHEIPRFFSEDRPYFSKKTAFIELLFSVPMLVGFLSQVFKKHEPDAIIVEQKSGFFEFILSAFSQKYQSALILYQHGYEMFHNPQIGHDKAAVKSQLLKTLSYTFTKILIFGLQQRPRGIKYNLCLLYSKYAEQLAKQQLDCAEFYICGNLSVRSIAVSEELKEQSVDGLLICSNGFLRYSDLNLRTKTLRAISSIYRTFKAYGRVNIRLKPGEFLEDREFSHYSLQSEDFVNNSVEIGLQLQEYSYIACSDISTIGLECCILKKKLLLYSVGESPYSFFPFLYQKMGVSVVSQDLVGDEYREGFSIFSNVDASGFEFYTGALNPGGYVGVTEKICRVIESR